MPNAPVGPRPIVLVVEDEPLMRMMAVDLVEDAGFEALEAANAAQAVAILERRTDIRIVFTDVDMPRGMDGIRLAAMVRDRWPPIEIIITSGKLGPHPDTMPARSVYFSKPYRTEQIVGMLRQMAA